MSWLFRRRIRVIPGVRLNLSKSGLTASVGVRGGSVTLGGKGGTYANVGIPGTGIYSRRRIGKKNSSSFEEENSFNGETFEENFSTPDEKFVNTLYQNVLGRAPDTSGLNYWLGQLNSGAETRYEALLGFAESAENKGLFTEMTGLG